MKTIFTIAFLFLAGSVSSQQFYVRGEVKDEAGNPLQNVTILHHGTGYVYHTGLYGSFGFTTHKQVDTLTFTLNGYQKERILYNADNFVVVRLKTSQGITTSVRRFKLASMTKDLAKETQRQWFAGDETYASIIENRFVDASKYPATGMALNIDRASYSNIRRFLNMNTMVPPDAVRIEEMLNYFNQSYSEPEQGEMFKVNSMLTSCPWNDQNQLYFVNVFSKKINVDTLPPSNLVFLIDVSGSMDMPNRLPLLKSAFRLLVNNLREKDTVSIVVYGGVVGVMLHPTSGGEKEKIFKAIDELVPGGSTPGESGVRMAYTMARNHFIKNGNNRVILATDGDFNVGLKTEEELEDLISQHRETGIYLTCLGVGMGNYKDSKIQTLAKKGNGNFAYFDHYQEAEKVLLKEFTQTLYAVADDVYMNVAFNGDYVREYRLIGFDNKVGALADTLSSIEGGEIGSGNSLMAVFEIQPTSLNVRASGFGRNGDKFAEVMIEYREPGNQNKKLFKGTSFFKYTPFAELDKCYRFSTALVMFGSLLRSSQFVKNISWNDVLMVASAAYEPDDVSQKEFINMIQQARVIYTRKKKKRDHGDN